MNWNPDDPVVIGPEWFASKNVVKPLNLDGAGYAVTVYPSATGESWTSVSVWIKDSPPGAGYVLDVYQGEQVPLTLAQLQTVIPSYDILIQNVNNVVDQSGAVIAAPTPIATYNDGNYAVFNTAAPQQLHLSLDPSGAWGGLTSLLRIYRVELLLSAWGDGPGPIYTGWRVAPGIMTSVGGKFFAGAGSSPDPLASRGWGENDVRQGVNSVAWTVGRLHEFDNSTIAGIVVGTAPGGTYSGPVNVGYLALKVTYDQVQNDQRIRFSYQQNQSTVTGDQLFDFNFTDVLTGASVPINTNVGEPITFVLRAEAAVPETQSIGGSWASLDSGLLAPVTHRTHVNTFVPGTGAPLTDDGGNFLTDHPYLVPRFLSTSPLASGQPYGEVNRLPVDASHWASMLYGDITQTMQYLRCMVSYDDLAPPEESLIITITDSLVGTVVSTSYSRLQIDNMSTFVGEGWRDVVLDVGPLPAAATNAYTVKFTSYTDINHPWYVAQLAGSVGVNDYLAMWQPARITTQDGISYGNFPAVLMIKPPTPSTALVTQLSQPVSGCAVPCITSQACPVTGIPYNHVTWTSPGVTGLTDWELQRQDTIDLTWQTIAKLGKESSCDGLILDGSSAAVGASTADNAALDLTTAVDLRGEIAIGSEPSAIGDVTTPGAIVAKYGPTNQRAYGLFLRSDGRLQMEVSNTGGIVASGIAVSVVPIAPLDKNVPVLVRGRWSGTTDNRATFGVSSWASTPDLAALDIVGDIDIRVEAALSNWATGGDQPLVGKWDTGTANKSYLLSVDAIGNLKFSWTTNGSTVLTATSTLPIPVTNFSNMYLRATLDVASGSGYQVDFYYSLNGTQYNILGESTVTTAGATSIFSGNATFTVGGTHAGSTVANGRFGSASLRSGLISPTVVASPAFSSQTVGTTSFVDALTRVWTMNGNTILAGDVFDFFWGYPSNVFNIDDATVTATTWQKLGTSAYGPSLTLFNSTSSLTVGNTNVLDREWKGCVRKVRVLNGTPANVANPNFDAQPVGTLSFADSSGRTWFIGGAGVIGDPFPAQVFDDYEARLCTGVTNTYRVRSIAFPGMYSDWLSTAAVNATGGNDNAVYFTSNEDPSLNVAYPDVYDGTPDQSYTFLSADETAFVRLYGRDYQVALRPSEVRGVQFTRNVLINALCVPNCGKRGDTPFDPIRDLSVAPLSYVCVKDNDGNRWYAALRVPAGHTRRKRISMSQIEITEVTASPSQPSSQ